MTAKSQLTVWSAGVILVSALVVAAASEGISVGRSDGWSWQAAGRQCSDTAPTWANADVAGSLYRIATSMRALGDSAYDLLSEQLAGGLDSPRGAYQETAALVALLAASADPASHDARLLYGELLYQVASAVLYEEPWRWFLQDTLLGEAEVDTVTLKEAERQLHCALYFAQAAGDTVASNRAEALLWRVGRLIEERRSRR